MGRKVNPKSPENDHQNQVSCKFRYFKLAKTLNKSKTFGFFTGNYIVFYARNYTVPRFLDFWRMSGHPAVQMALRNHGFDSLGLPRLHVPAQA